MADLSKLRFNGTDYNVKDTSAPKRKFDNTYAKTGNLPITSDDTPQTAIGKLEKAHDTNQANISLVESMNGAKNLLYVPNGKYTLSSNSNVTAIDGTLTYNSTTSVATATTLTTITLDAGTYVMMNRQVKPSPSSGSVYGDVRLLSLSGNTNITTGEPAIFTLDTATTLKVTAITYSSLISDMSIKPMIITKAAYDAGFIDYRHYALSNVQITPALIECVDAGAKNKLDYEAWKTVAVSGGTAVWENNGVTLTSTAADCYTAYNPSVSNMPASVKIPVKQGDILVMSWEYEIASGVTAEAYIFPNGIVTGSVKRLISDRQLIYTVPSGVTYVTYRVGVRDSGNVAKWKNVMICTLAAWKVSQKFVPYRPDYDNVIQKITPTIGTITASDTDITISKYYLTKLNGMAYFSLTANSSVAIAAGGIITVGYVDAASAKKYQGQTNFTASVDGHSEISCNAWIAAGVAVQNIRFRPDTSISANTNFYITGFYPC